MANPPTSSVCCDAGAVRAASSTRDGKLLSNFGGPGQGYQWPQSPGSLAVDAKGNVWIPAAGLEPAPPPVAGSEAASTPRRLESPRREAPPAGAPQRRRRACRRARAEVLARRQVPAADRHAGQDGRSRQPDDAESSGGGGGRRRRQRGLRRRQRQPTASSCSTRTPARSSGIGAPTARSRAPPAVALTIPSAPPARQFRDVTCIEIAKDDNVYVCDREQQPHPGVLRRTASSSGKAIVSKDTLGATVTGQFGFVSSHGAVWDIAFSNDAGQQYMFVADGHDKKVMVVQRDTLAEVGSVRHRRASTRPVPGRGQHRRRFARQRLHRRAASRQARSEVRDGPDNTTTKARGHEGHEEERFVQAVSSLVSSVRVD